MQGEESPGYYNNNNLSEITVLSVCLHNSRWLKVSIAFIKLLQLLRRLCLEWRSTCEALVDNCTNTPQVGLGIITQRH